MDFEIISKKLKQFSKDTVTEVQKLNEVRQLNAGINDEKKQLELIYAAMGKKLWQQYKEAPLEGFEDEMRTIEEKYSKIDLLQDQIRRVKGVVLCPCCNTEMAATERFCSNCGSKMPEVISISEEEAQVLEGEVVEAEAADGSETEQTEAAAPEEDNNEAEAAAAEDNERDAVSCEKDETVSAEMTGCEAGEDQTSEKTVCEEVNRTSDEGNDSDPE